MISTITVPNFIGIASSSKGEGSYSLFSDTHIGAAIVDRFTYYTSQFFKTSPNASFKEWSSGLSSNVLLSQLFSTSTLQYHNFNIKDFLLHEVPKE